MMYSRRYLWGICCLVLAAHSALGSSSEVETIDSLCEGCIMWQGEGYKDMPDCRDFVHCVFKDDGSLDTQQSAVKQCKNGLFWSQIHLTCTNATGVECPADPCLFIVSPDPLPRTQNLRRSVRPARAWTSSRSCREYWTCVGRRTEGGRCCPKGQSPAVRNGVFNGCVANATCRDKCGYTPEKAPVYDYCKQFGPHSNRRFYIWTHGGQVHVMPCPPGTLFDTNECQCLRSRPGNVARDPADPQTPHTGGCKRDLYIPLKGHYKDISDNTSPVDLANPANADSLSTGVFSGMDNIRINRFSNAHFGNTFAIQTKLHENRDGPAVPMTLFSNGCDRQTAPIHVSIDRTGLIEAKIVINNEVKQLKLNTANAPKILTLAYDGTRVFLQARYSDSNRTKEQVPANGNVPNHQCALVIGSETNAEATPERNFKGQMEEIMVYLCVPNGVKEDMKN